MRDWLSLIRPANSIMVGFAVIVGIVVSVNRISFSLAPNLLLGFLTGFAISAFSMVTNDVYDLSVDKVNQPKRALPSGRITTSGAARFAIFFLALGIVCAGVLGAETLLIASVFAIIGWYYNYHGKSLGIPGNSLVALSLAIPYIFGSVEMGQYTLNLAYLLALTSFTAGLGREVLKGIADVEGDKIRNVRTLALVRGTRSAKNLTSLLFVLAVISTVLPFLFNLLGSGLIVYAVLILIPDAIFLYLAARTLTMEKDSDSLRLKGIALAGMFLGLVAYLIAGLSV